MDEALVVIDVVDRLGAVLHLPDDDRGNFDRTAVQFIDLELAGFEIAYPQRNLLLAVEGIVPAQAVGLDRADVFAEQAQYRGLVGLHLVQPDQAEEGQRQYQQAEQEIGDGGRALRIVDIRADAGDEQPDARGGDHEHRDQEGDAGQRADWVLFHGGSRVMERAY